MSVSYTLRIPDDLMRLLQQCSHESGESLAQTVIIACWNYLERQGDDVMPSGPRDKPIATISDTKPDMAVLRAICAGQVTLEAETPEVRMCQYREYDQEQGEWYGCRLSEHGPKVKHVRGPKL